MARNVRVAGVCGGGEGPPPRSTAVALCHPDRGCAAAFGPILAPHTAQSTPSVLARPSIQFEGPRMSKRKAPGALQHASVWRAEPLRNHPPCARPDRSCACRARSQLLAHITPGCKSATQARKAHEIAHNNNKSRKTCQISEIDAIPTPFARTPPPNGFHAAREACHCPLVTAPHTHCDI